MIMSLPLNKLGSDSLITLTLPSNYGYCVLVAVGSMFVVMWKGIKVGKARKVHNVPYPKMYSETSDLFNCVQRAHQNTLENYPQFLTLLLLGGMDSPLVTAVAGSVWLLGRIVYARGYYTGDPKKRMQGSFAYFGLLAMIGTTTRLALKLLHVI